MIRYKLPSNTYHLLGDGKVLKAGGEDLTIDSTIPVGDIISIMVKSGLAAVEIYTHIQTSWTGNVTNARRRKVAHPMYIGSMPFLMRSGTFSNNKILYAYNIRETYAGAGDMCEHKSDVLCTVLKGRFRAGNQKELEIMVREYSKVANQFYLHLYDPRNTEKKVGDGPCLSKSHFEMLKAPVSKRVKPPTRVLEFRECNDSEFELQDLRSLHEPKLSALEIAAAISIGGTERNRRGESTLEKVSWDEIGGFEAQKKQARRFVRQVLNPDAAGYFGRDPAEKGGMIFIGPTGWGKSLFARACATEVMNTYKGKVHYIRATYGETGSKWRAEEAAIIAADFKRIRKWAEAGDLSIYFLEEIQSTAERDESPQKSNELLDELLVQTGDFNYTRVLMMAATARDISKLDPQLVRGKRFGEHVFIGPPMTVDDATNILVKIIKKRDQKAREKGIKNLIDSKGLCYKILGQELTDFSPSDIWYVVENALSIREDDYHETNIRIPLTEEFLLDCIKKMRAEKVGQSTDVNQL